MIIVSEVDNSLINQLVKWLKFYNYDSWIRVNENSLIEEFIYILTDAEEQLNFYSKENENYISIDQHNVFSYRGLFKFRNTIDIPFFYNQLNNLSQSLNRIINSKSHSVAGLSEQYNMKLFNLFLAKKLGLGIPDTYLGSSDKLEEIFLKYKSNNFITKSITNIFRYEIPTKGNFIGPGTILLNHKDFKRDKIFPSLIQRAIQKEFDIRSVFIEGEFYSLAIFSPKLSETIDFRDLYASKIIPRNIPFNLPQDIKDKLTLMAKELYLKFCSFDLIYSSSSEFIFIEVNPEGIVDWVSLYGNFNIAGILCQNLINNEKRRN